MVSPVTTATSHVLYFKFSDGNGFRYIDGNQVVMLAYDAVPNNARLANSRLIYPLSTGDSSIK
jgi:hypothetical protein